MDICIQGLHDCKANHRNCVALLRAIESLLYCFASASQFDATTGRMIQTENLMAKRIMEDQSLLSAISDLRSEDIYLRDDGINPFRTILDRIIEKYLPELSDD